MTLPVYQNDTVAMVTTRMCSYNRRIEGAENELQLSMVVSSCTRCCEHAFVMYWMVSTCFYNILDDVNMHSSCRPTGQCKHEFVMYWML